MKISRNTKGFVHYQLIIIIVLVVALIGFVAYKVTNTNKQANQQSGQTSQQAEPKEELTVNDENDKGNEVTVPPEGQQASPVTDDQVEAWKTKIPDLLTISKSIDPEFKTIYPSCGFGDSGEGKKTFKWSEHKDAIRYILRIRYQHKTAFPLSIPDRTIEYPNHGFDQPDIMSIDVDIEKGNYYWAVSAETRDENKPAPNNIVLLQLTDDCSYQLF